MSDTRVYATGKRKTSVARCWLIPGGSGQIYINRRVADTYFTRPTLLQVIRQPLSLTDNLDKFDVMATVRGGGHTGQAGALRHGIAKALAEQNPELHKALKKAGFLSRDARKKERKKYGQPGARARFQYSKR
ncbi:30S ribosomal protein S9 [Desulfoferula mesophila]|uniref:Small ribosomal subunit protein uS9 n=1 Tax=Desulfoferula mesophila TaxID=3058419 RepID=A0AAU9F1X9_9BACT|nr:30S ribosomal protein S9 [Desulfoferula mesophilus]